MLMEKQDIKKTTKEYRDKETADAGILGKKKQTVGRTQQDWQHGWWEISSTDPACPVVPPVFYR